MTNYLDCFKEIYKREPDYTAFTPYRVCPLGAHIDHQLGKVTGFAIDKGIHLAYSPKHNGVIEVRSLQFEKRAQWHVAATPDVKEGDWADPLRGATIALTKRFPLRTGLSAVIEGELPIGGLSSSAAIIITFLSALCMLNNICIESEELIDIAKEAENKYLGVSCGRLDQSCEIYSKKDHLLVCDFLTGEHKVIPNHENLPKFKVGVFFSGLEHNLAASKYNMRVDEARAAGYSVLALAGKEYGKFNDTNLREVPLELFERYKDRIPENFKKRAEHFYSEFERVNRGVELWVKGDLVGFGKLMFESGASSIYNWETGSPELIELYNIMRETKGIYGGRFSGAGFKGCCVALIDPQYEESIAKSVKEKYLAKFPEHAEKYSSYFCLTADGVKV